jgi:hypothetical protein
LTGGPGAGKTAILEMAKKTFSSDIAFLPEAASIIYGGGFWRLPSVSAKRCAQVAIYHVQRQMENLVIGENKWPIGLCDRGSLDGLAYWPQETETFWKMSQSSMEKEYANYKAIIHLKTPNDHTGYNHVNPLRIETAHEAKKIDNQIELIWKNHPDYNVIESSENFLVKAEKALELIAKYKAIYS